MKANLSDSELLFHVSEAEIVLFVEETVKECYKLRHTYAPPPFSDLCMALIELPNAD